MGYKVNIMVKKITVVTVCFNAEKVLEQTMLSVLSQTYKDIEYLVIDGGSKDGTLDIIKKYSDKVKWISEPDKGIYDAMNKAIKMASGEWINFMNAGDCFASIDVLENVFSKEYPEEVNFLYSDNWYEDEKGIRTYAPHDHKSLSLNHQSCIYRKSLHSVHGQYIVTPKIIVSDLLFFASIPQDYFLKVDVPISVNRTGGVSAASWCIEQALCTKVVFRKLSFGSMILHYISGNLKRKIKFLNKF